MTTKMTLFSWSVDIEIMQPSKGDLSTTKNKGKQEIKIDISYLPLQIKTCLKETKMGEWPE